MLSRILSFLKIRKEALLLLCAAVIITSITCIHYTLTLLSWTDIGFTLDDSWIHLEYARSIFEHRAWEYSLGYPSTGSTSPLWSILLSFLFFFTTEYHGLIWGVFVVSWLFYSLCTYLVGYFVTKLSKSKMIGIVAMSFYVIIPRNTWLMLSGMEYPLFLFLLLLPLYILERPEYQFDLALGVVAGLTFLARPEGAVLAVVAFSIRIAQHVAWRDFTKQRLVSVILMPILAGLIVLPWLLYCIQTTGYPLPDTFYAKVGIITQEHVDAWNIFWLAFLGEMPFLLTGVLLGVLTLMKKRPYAWFMGIAYFLLYRFTMPYQALINNSRYVVPIFAFLGITCIVAFGIFSDEIRPSTPRLEKEMARTGVVLVLVSLVFFTSIPAYFNQAELFGNATKNINEMQVDIGHWIARETPDDAILAVCDVGAVRFISNRTIIDLCGLVTPDIAHGNFTSFQLANYLESRETDYLIIFGKWVNFYNYILYQHLTELYRVTLLDNRVCGDDVMVVFKITW
ncbi:MAG: hypothetical protein ACFFF4_15550 [Candidatus Thorarchaeota archaeon]